MLHNPSLLDPSYSHGKAVPHLHWRNDNSQLYQSNTVLHCSFRPNYSLWWNIHPQKCPGLCLTLHIHASAFLIFVHKASWPELWTRRQVFSEHKVYPSFFSEGKIRWQKSKQTEKKFSKGSLLWIIAEAKKIDISPIHSSTLKKKSIGLRHREIPVNLNGFGLKVSMNASFWKTLSMFSRCPELLLSLRWINILNVNKCQSVRALLPPQERPDPEQSNTLLSHSNILVKINH